MAHQHFLQRVKVAFRVVGRVTGMIRVTPLIETRDTDTDTITVPIRIGPHTTSKAGPVLTLSTRLALSTNSKAGHIPTDSPEVIWTRNNETVPGSVMRV